MHYDRKQLVQAVNGHELNARLLEYLLPRHAAKGLLEHTVGPAVTVVVRVSDQGSVPATTDADRALVEQHLGVTDAWPVRCGPYVDWVIEAFGELMQRRDSIRGLQIVEESPILLAGFRGRIEDWVKVTHPVDAVERVEGYRGLDTMAVAGRVAQMLSSSPGSVDRSKSWNLPIFG